ncbi:DNA invertase Pin-like site-specific DNA recombinase [Bradyrhizobium elkanii]|uniref:recombinase family protein n=1 Tax=Bradyrhizobium elkanii TaxID=29448 RepID=UPI002166C877|nr:recombinase family protein [Bradyrhizobium elkanii]MCS3687533.1 DNA invertase Pin-like site-specific DNA recombinase [Bradyrhizobium elkanii]
MKPRAYSYLRMSTAEQLKGDSRRRQLEKSRAYADEHGLELAEVNQLEDIGISAFRGDNVRDGALGRFLDVVKAGSVQRGSYLLVESLDRLSREDILPALTLFLSIVQAGITLVTLTDKRVYRAEDIEMLDLMTTLVVMERSNNESVEKSDRVGNAWKQKRVRAAGGEPMTARCPAWLALAPDRKSYQVVPERAEIVRQIFADTVAGMGMFSIATRLNKAGVPAFEGKKGWHRSYLAKTLDNRAVIGEFQPHTKVSGTRVPDGEPIKGYYPAIVAEDLFFRAQHSRSQRKIGGAGRKGPGYANLFTGLARCAYCHSRITFENKGAGTRGGTYLICSDAQRGRGCTATRWKYLDFEASFLAFVQELDLESILNANEDAAKRKALEDELRSLRGELASISESMEKTYAVLNAGGPPEFIAGKLNELSAKKATLSALLESKEAEQNHFAGRDLRLYISRDEIRDLVSRLQMPPSDELYRLRAQIASRLKVLVETLLVAPQGRGPISQKVIRELQELAGANDADVIAHMRSVAGESPESRRYFAVGFRDAAVRVVFPTYDNPLLYEQQIVADNRAKGGETSIEAIYPDGSFPVA